MRILVTGNLGYVGTVMTPLLKAEGHEVWGLDTGYYAPCIMGDAGPTGVDRQIMKDVRRVEASDLEGVHGIAHLAALSNDPTGELNPGLTEEINFHGSVRLAEAAKRAGVERFVFASSCSIYGSSGGEALTEEASFNPLTAYARSKVDTEAALARMADASFSPVFLRNATAYGFSPRLRFDIVVNNLTGWAMTTGHVKLLSDGRAWRPLVHVEDMCRAFAASFVAPRERIHNQAFNVGREEDNFQIRTLAESVAMVVPDCDVTFAEGASADSRNYNVSFAKARERLKEFAPRWSVEKGIHQLYGSFSRLGLTYPQFDGRYFTRLKQLRYLVESERVDDHLMWNRARAR
jgi:nucleoside-diphosphate-sugar epimerase